MARLVVDASVALTWCFEDEATPWGDALLARIRGGDQVVVPAIWPSEIANSLLIAIRRSRIEMTKARRFVDDLCALPIAIDPVSAERVLRQAFLVAAQYKLTVYDATYLELAVRERLPIATLDDALRSAARAEGASLLP